MLILRRGLPVGALCLVPFLLMGCGASPQSPGTAQPAETVPAPVFASNEEALAAATTAYGKYIAMSDQISNEGGVQPERIAPFVTAGLLPDEMKQFVDLQTSSIHSTGLTGLRVISMQSARYESPQTTEISLYVCEDVAGIDVVDSSGRSLVSATREAVSGFVARLVSGSNTQLVVAGRDFWTGRTFC